jgi:hypothetical protein
MDFSFKQVETEKWIGLYAASSKLQARNGEKVAIGGGPQNWDPIWFDN